MGNIFGIRIRDPRADMLTADFRIDERNIQSDEIGLTKKKLFPIHHTPYFD